MSQSPPQLTPGDRVRVMQADDRPAEAYRRIVDYQDRDMTAAARTCSERGLGERAPEQTHEAYRRIIDRQDRVITDLVCLCHRNGLGGQIESPLHDLANIAMAIERADETGSLIADCGLRIAD